MWEDLGVKLEQNLSQCVIASKIGRSKTVIVTFLKDPDVYGTKKHTGWPNKNSLALGRRIRKNLSQSSNQFKARTDAQGQLHDI